MTNYLIRRFFQMILVVLLSTVAIYMLLNLAPGGPLSGLRLGTDRKTKITEADIERLKAYLGLDKPLFLRYLTWLVGDDWLGADWMYLGLGQYREYKVNSKGERLYNIDAQTAEKTYIYTDLRFWVDPGPMLFNPAYDLWIWGERVGTQTVSYATLDGTQITVEAGVYRADQVRVKPPAGSVPPADVTVYGEVYRQEGDSAIVISPNKDHYVVEFSRQTTYEFPTGEGKPRPEEGIWLNIAWLTGYDGLMSKYAAFHGSGHGLLRLDFGKSWKLSAAQPVTDLIKSRLGNTLILMATASIISMIIAIPIGIYSGVHQYSKVDYAVTTFAFFGSAMPVFWFGLMLILVFSHGFKQWDLPYMPSGGVTMVRESQPGSVLAIMNVAPGSLVDRVVHIILPAAMLSLAHMASWSRYMRSSMLEVLRQDYVRTARAKGLIERVVIVKHALRNALIPIVTIIVFQIPALFGGATLTETIFAYPGLGRLYFDALGANDWPVMMAILFIDAVLVVFATLLGDVLYTVVDPRIRFK
jgi:peptide/nickel transport system permease protein